MTGALANIKKAVERAAECPAKHIESAEVIEGFRHQIVWTGTVEIFDLIGHPNANRAYGWQEGERFVAVLEIPPVDSASTAVRAAIAASQKSTRN